MAATHPDFNEVYREFQPRIVRYMARMVGDDDAEDLTQEVFAKVARSVRDFRGDSQLSTWVYRIATNAALDKLRGSPREAAAPLDEQAESRLDRNTWTGETVPAVESQIYRKEMSECIHQFIGRIPENYRTVLVLADFEGLQNEDIGEVLGLTLETVKIRLHRGRERLRNELMKHCGPEWLEDNEFLPELGEARVAARAAAAGKG